MNLQRDFQPHGLRLVALAIVAAAIVAAVVLLRPGPELPAARALDPATFSELEGWSKDDHAAVLKAFARSCARWAKAPDAVPLLAGSGLGAPQDWRAVCDEAAKRVAAPDPNTDPDSDARARAFFETRFEPFAVSNNGREKGLFTAYFQIEVAGDLLPRDPPGVPLYARPDDLVQVDLGRFREEFTGRSISGRLERGRLVPYSARAEIDSGALVDQGLEIAWIDNPVDAFFLHIQGSGRIRLPDGSLIDVGYDGSNGHAYTTLGGLMIERGLLPAGGASMPAIRQWIAANPDDGAALMAENARFIFFRRLGTGAPMGAQGVPLTPGRSLAVDRKYLPLGVPLWLETQVPSADGGDPVPFRRLMVAQDTGSAITGPVRGDIYWGTGPEAGALAGRMKYPGRYFVLVPKAVAARLH